MESIFVHLSEAETQSEVICWLEKFGRVGNFDDAKALSTSGCIVYGDVKKIYPPVLLQNGTFNCVFMMEQVTHLLAPHEEFRILLQLKSPDPLLNLEVGSFLAVFNPRPFSVAKTKCFSSGPEEVIVWYSKAQVPISRLEAASKLARPGSIASSLNVLPIKNSFNTSLPQLMASTSTAYRPGANEDRFDMPPPSVWIDMRRNQKSISRSKGRCNATRDYCTSETSSKKSHAHSSMHHKSKCSHRSVHHSHRSELCCSACRTDLHCCSHYEHPRNCRATCQPHVSCCSHIEPPACHSSSHPICGCSRTCAFQQWVPSSCSGNCHHHINPSKSSECCANCGNSNKEKTHVRCPNKTCEKLSSSNEEGNGWFVKNWVQHTKSRIGEEKPYLPSGRQDIDSQLLTTNATHGGSVVGDVSSDDDNFTSVSQVLPTLPSSQGFKHTASSSDDDSGSSLSDTSTLFLKPKNTLKPSVRADPIVKDNKSTQIEPVPDACDDIELAEESQSTCLQLFSVQSILPSKRPGCEASSEESSTPTKKKRKLFDPADSSYYFDTARRDLEGPSPSKQNSSKKSPAKPSEAIQPSIVEDERPNGRFVESAGEESVGIIHHHVECNLKNVKNKRSHSTPLVSGLSRDRLLEGIIEEWASDSNSSNSVVPVLKTAHDILKDPPYGNNQVAKESTGPSPAVFTERNPTVCQDAGENPNDLLSHHSLKKVSSSSDMPLSKDPLPTACVSLEHDPELSHLLTRASLSTQLSPESPIFSNETVFVAEMSQTLCEPSEEMSSTNPTAQCVSQNPVGNLGQESKKPVPCEHSELRHKLPTNTSITVPDCNDNNRILETQKSSEEVSGPITFDVAVTVDAEEANFKVDRGQALCEVPEYASNVSEALLGSNSQIIPTHDEPLRDDAVNIPAATSKNLLSDAAPNMAGVINTNRISETESSSSLPTMAEASSNSMKEGLRRHSPDSTTDGQSEEIKEDETRNSPASTVFYDAEGGDLPKENNQEGKTVSSIVIGVCRRGCKSRFSYDSVLQLPIITRSCATCACQSHHTCPICRESGLKKALCLEFAFELHVLIGEKVLRLQVESQEAVKFLGIRAREILRKSRRAMEIVGKLESLCCEDPEEETCRLTGHIRVATELRQGKIVPLLVGARLKDFKMGEVPQRR